LSLASVHGSPSWPRSRARPRAQARCAHLARSATPEAACAGAGGAGARRTPPQPMKAGDVVEIEIDTVGVLRDPIAVG
jgi:hypothetical protein